MKIPIYHKDIKLSDLIVDNLFNRCYEAYCIFRPNGDEIEVRLKDDVVVNKDDLDKIENEFFESGFYKKLKE